MIASWILFGKGMHQGQLDIPQPRHTQTFTSPSINGQRQVTSAGAGRGNRERWVSETWGGLFARRSTSAKGRPVISATEPGDSPRASKRQAINWVRRGPRQCPQSSIAASIRESFPRSWGGRHLGVTNCWKFGTKSTQNDQTRAFSVVFGKAIPSHMMSGFAF